MRVAPDARASSWEDVADLSSAFGLVLDPWQEQVFQAAMGERADGRWTAQQVGLSVPRQNGKSALVVARALAGALLFDERLIVVTAHQADTYRESTWTDLMNLVESSSALSSRIRRNGVMAAINRESVTFNNGSRIKFKARTGTGGRGFSADCLLLDEAQMLPRQVWATIYSTQSARDNPQTWLTGTPPTVEDDPFAFKAMRDAVVAGRTTRVAYLEWSAEPTDDPATEETRAKANPAWDTRINHDVVQGEFETYSAAQFAEERLGIWRSDATATRLVSAEEWAAVALLEAPEGVKSFGVAFSADGERVAIGGARKHQDGVHVELIDAQQGMAGATGVSLMADWLAERWRDTAQIAISGRAGAKVLEEALQARGVPRRLLWVASTEQYTTSCAMLLDAVREGTATHTASEGQAQLDESVAVCDRKLRGNTGAWGWEPTSPDGDETPLEAISLAHWAARTTRRRPGQGRTTGSRTSGNRTAVVT